MRLARQTFFYFIFIHAAPFYSFFALCCWRRGRNSSGRSARSCSRCRQMSQRQKSHTHELISRARHAARDWAARGCTATPLSLYTSPLTAYPSPFFFSVCQRRRLRFGSCFALLFFSPFFSPLHLPFICMFVCDCIKRVVACSVLFCLCLFLCLFLYLLSTLPRCP